MTPAGKFRCGTRAKNPNKSLIYHLRKPSRCAKLPVNCILESHLEEKQEQIAVSYIPPALDEKQALRLEQHLLELDPSLRKHEARFYARHCTLGKSYTIAQYKRMIGCVYETARTAMDHLVELGYYRKDSSNKKFIYTPIPRK